MKCTNPSPKAVCECTSHEFGCMQDIQLTDISFLLSSAKCFWMLFTKPQKTMK